MSVEQKPASGMFRLRDLYNRHIRAFNLHIAPVALFLLLCPVAGAQGLFKVSLDEKVSHSALIVEGKVVGQTGFWNRQHTMIYTSNRVEVYKTFKGVCQAGSVDIITLGGTVGDHFISASHLLKLDLNDVGVFFCRKDRFTPLTPGVTEKGYDVYSSSQGFFKYDADLRSAYAPFVQYKNIAQQLYSELKAKTGKAIGIINKSFSVRAEDALEGQHSVLGTAALSITSFSPATVNAGTLLDPANNVLTINGTGFGSAPTSPSAVLFDNPDDGGGGSFTQIPYNFPLIISWTDTQIKVRVPSGSGTGAIRVINNAGNIVSSPTDLIVNYNILDAYFLVNGTLTVRETRLINANGLGGYSVFYSSNTANNGIDMNASGAKATFQRALTTWKENSGFNVTEGGLDTLQTIDPNDSLNMIMFDNSAPGNSPLPSGVLAVCFSSGAFCPDNVAANQAFKPGFDIVIRNEAVSTGPPVSFVFGPCSPYTNNTTDVDLESVLFHELGHAINMGHIIDPREGGTAGASNPARVMNFALSRGLKRVSEDYSARTGAAYIITPKGTPLGVCAPSGEMVPLSTIAAANDECPATFPAASTPPNTTIAFDLAHAGSNKLVDPYFTQVTTDGTGTAVTNTAYYAFKTNSTGGSLSLTVSGYATVPASASACLIGPPGIPVTGVQLAIYQVAACPAGLAYPTPVVSTSFQGDGIIPSINGLAANTNYLMMLDGVENTKAIFNISFAGSSLPLKIIDFAGEALALENKIWWKTELPENVSGIRLERSADGKLFTAISAGLAGSDSYHDLQPLPGINYYRLAVVDNDASIQYSPVIVLNRKPEFSFGAYPNPSRQAVTVHIGQAGPGRYALVLYNAMGQQVLDKRITITGDSHVEKISLEHLSTGIYHIGLLNNSGGFVRSVTVAVK